MEPSKTSKPAIDFLSSSFNPLVALNIEEVVPPRPNVRVFNCLEEYVESLTQSKVFQSIGWFPVEFEDPLRSGVRTGRGDDLCNQHEGRFRSKRKFRKDSDEKSQESDERNIVQRKKQARLQEAENWDRPGDPRHKSGAPEQTHSQSRPNEKDKNRETDDYDSYCHPHSMPIDGTPGRTSVNRLTRLKSISKDKMRPSNPKSRTAISQSDIEERRERLRQMMKGNLEEHTKWKEPKKKRNFNLMERMEGKISHA